MNKGFWVVLLLMFAGYLSAQPPTTTTYVGTVKDLTGATVTSGRITFQLNAPQGGVIPGTGSFVSTTVSCSIDANGHPVSTTDGTSPCVITNNTALTPTGTSYTMCTQPQFVSPGSCIVTFAPGGTVDISTVVPVPTTGPFNFAGTPGPPGPMATPSGTHGQVQINQYGLFGVDAGFTYDSTGHVLTAPNLTVPGTANVHIPPSGVQWPASCSTGTYVPASNTCVAPGTAANPAGSTGEVQFNSSGIFGNIVGSMVESNGNVRIPAVNGVYDLKAAWGASGSNQTMTCTATSGNSTLTGCTGGDFKIGQWVFIPQAGAAPTAVAPAGLTTVCAADGTGSCTGSTVYCYEIATVQGAPNGAMSAPTSPSCVTQGTQIPQRAANSTQPDVYTTVSWTAATNAALYAVYKSINGGPYNFYTLVAYSAVTINDYGSFAPTIMTCVDVSIPCTAPAGTTPNDVYATISAISGGTVTLTSRSYVPVFITGQGINGPYPSQPSVSGSVSVQHDDTPAFQAMHDSLLGVAGNKKVHIPAGNYNLHSEGAASGWQHAITLAGLRNVVIEGDGDGTYLYAPNDRSASFGRTIVANCGDPDAPGVCTAFNYGGTFATSVPRNAIADPVNVGSTQVVLTTPSDASNYPPGTYITLYNTGTNPYPNYFYMELNLVVSSDATSGVVNLAYPATKQYTTTPTQYPFTLAPAAAFTGGPKISPVIGGVSAYNITMRSFRIRAQTYGFNQHAVNDYLTFENINATVSNWNGSGTNRHITFRNNTITEDGYTPMSGIIQSSAADVDVTVVNNTYKTPHAFGSNQMCTEGSTNVHIENNDLTYSGTNQLIGNGGTQANNTAIIMMTAMCFNSTFNKNTVSVANSRMSWMIWADNTIGGNEIAHNKLYVDAISSSVPASLTSLSLNLSRFPDGIHAYDNKLTIGNTNTTFAGGAGTMITSGPTWPALTSFAVSPTNSFNYVRYLGQYTIMELTLTQNLLSVNLTDSTDSIPHSYFALDFVQPASGGPYTMPPDCTNAKWATTNGNGIDCPNGPPVAQTTANSHTIVWFLVDGANNVHVDHINYIPATGLSGVVATVAPNTFSGTAGIANTTFYTTPAGTAHQYRACVFESLVAAGTAGTAQIVIYATVDAHAATQMVATTNLTLTGGLGTNQNMCGSFYADVSTIVQWRLFMGGATGTPTVRYAVALEQLQ